MREKIPQGVQRTRQASNFRRRKSHPRYEINDVVCIILAIWMISAYIAVLIAYLITKDTTIVVSWTSCATLATIAFTYFFRKK